ncbi:helix-turn-helix transcriptional regulator [Pedobacter aquatilis]|uniref:helix-turn-helix domain-containing protein n=1 Tax=Pedobacter aquatilis TaxID=351343 RepID=UPI00292E67EF|nr:helix-turn-helix transcriptional regulator [Pedobacter aquatilis]
MDEISVFKAKLGRRIAFLRERNDLTQPELGALINKDFQSISRIENGKVNLSAFTLKQISDALNVSMNDVFDFSELKSRLNRSKR